MYDRMHAEIHRRVGFIDGFQVLEVWDREARVSRPEFSETLIGRSGSRLTTAAGNEATVTVAGVTRLEARRLEVSRCGSRVPLCLLDVGPSSAAALRRGPGTQHRRRPPARRRSRSMR